MNANTKYINKVIFVVDSRRIFLWTSTYRKANDVSVFCPAAFIIRVT